MSNPHPPFKGTHHNVVQAKYATSLDERGFIPVWEYSINDHPIMWDRETGYVHFTGIWKALGNNKADVVKLVEGRPELQEFITKIRGGFLKIQGTWIKYENARQLASRTCYYIRKDLVPLFGPDFVDQCLEPNHKEFGQLITQLTKKRRKPQKTLGSDVGTIEGFAINTPKNNNQHVMLKRATSSSHRSNNNNNNHHNNNNSNNNKPTSVSPMMEDLESDISDEFDRIQSPPAPQSYAYGPKGTRVIFHGNRYHPYGNSNHRPNQSQSYSPSPRPLNPAPTSNTNELSQMNSQRSLPHIQPAPMSYSIPPPIQHPHPHPHQPQHQHQHSYQSPHRDNSPHYSMHSSYYSQQQQPTPVPPTSSSGNYTTNWTTAPQYQPPVAPYRPPPQSQSYPTQQSSVPSLWSTSSSSIPRSIAPRPSSTQNPDLTQEDIINAIRATIGLQSLSQTRKPPSSLPALSPSLSTISEFEDEVPDDVIDVDDDLRPVIRVKNAMGNDSYSIVGSGLTPKHIYRVPKRFNLGGKQVEWNPMGMWVINNNKNESSSSSSPSGPNSRSSSTSSMLSRPVSIPPSSSIIA